MPNQITIHIYPADQEEEGYMFDVYLDKSPDDIASDCPAQTTEANAQRSQAP